MRSNLREKSSFWNMSFAEMILQIRLQDNGVRISVRESWNRPPSSVQLKYGVCPTLPGRLSGQQEMRMRNYGVDLLLIRVVPPKPFGPLYRDEGAFFM